jgi:hypothetical protein
MAKMARPGPTKLIQKPINVKTYLARILALVAMSSVFVVSGYAATKITAVPFTITKAGTYISVGDLTLSGTGQTAITVNAGNVVIDLKGFSLGTSDTTFSNTGITVSTGAANVIVQNGSINNFGSGVNLLGPEETVQNLRCESGANGVTVQSTCTSSLIQNCFIAGSGALPASDIGVRLNGCADVVVRNNQIVSENQGGSSSGNNSFIANHIGSCTTGLSMGGTDKYQANVTTLCTTPFSGGTAVGDANN